MGNCSLLLDHQDKRGSCPDELATPNTILQFRYATRPSISFIIVSVCLLRRAPTSVILLPDARNMSRRRKALPSRRSSTRERRSAQRRSCYRVAWPPVPPLQLTTQVFIILTVFIYVSHSIPRHNPFVHFFFYFLGFSET